MNLKKLSPTPSFTITLPESVKTDDDPRIMSYWIEGDPFLLQLSSYLRSEGDQVSASTRLRDSTKDYLNDCQSVENLKPDGDVDQATTMRTDAEGDKWVQTYLVWPHLAVYATVIGPSQCEWAADNWAIAAIRTISPKIH